MKRRGHAPALSLGALIAVLAPRGPASAGDDMPLVHAGKAACTVVTVTAGEPDLLTRRAAEAITRTVSRWTGVALPALAVTGGQPEPALSDRPSLVLATLDALRRLEPSVEDRVPGVGRAAFTDPQGFCIVPGDPTGTPRLYIVSRTARGVFNGAVYARDFLIDGSAGTLTLRAEPAVRSPQMAGRAAYVLSIWGHEQEYTAEAWTVILDALARDGFDRVYFWVSGHFPSRQFPETYRCRDGEWDRTDKTAIGTVEDLRKIVRHGKALGLDMYLGGGLGGWVGTCFLTGNRKDTFKIGGGIAPRCLCPSHPLSRKALVAYYAEMFDALPEADGLYIESADEWGGCVCERCRVPVDDLGSTQFGQAQLTLIQELMRTVWTNHPHARLAYTIGYPEHRKDPAYYEAIRQMRDPRLEWMEARQSWTFPDRTGTERPAAHFSPRVLHWAIYEDKPLDPLIQDANRAAAEGLYGLAISFQPGFTTGSFYRDIPFPVDALPYVLTYFVYRELAWDAPLSPEALRERIRRRFFGREAAPVLADDLVELREMLRAASAKDPPRDALRVKLRAVAGRVGEARAAASFKTAEGLDLMERAIRDIRAHLRLEE